MKEQESGSEGAPAQRNDIAIIGMAARLPGARTVAEFWQNVRDGVESIRPLSDEELLAAGVSRSELDDPHYVKVCPVVADIDKFDARFFGFSPRDASVMDPAHRMFLELAWEAFEKAGYTALPDEGVVGVFASAGAPLYMQENVRTNPDLMRSMGEFLVRHTGNDMNFLATRVSYEMDLRGPSMNVQTACSSALVSLHMACQSLERGECTMALAGGATILIPHGRGYLYKEGEIMSPDGHCRPFDEKSAGTVFGSGAGCVVLKRLQDALDDGDTIHAVIKGSAINNDGSVKVGYLAPGVDGQAAVINAALARAGVPAESISYIETHGTGTSVGDPIEVEALNQAFASHTHKRAFCAIGSVKSNLGHLGEAAGIASLIKAVMALKHRQLPPSLGYEKPNPQIDFEHSPFFVNAKLRSWDSDGPRRCGVTALGAGGTNCHVILEEAPEPLEGEGAREQQLIVLSAKTRTALDQASENLAAALEQQPELDLADAAYTLSLGRRALPHRRALSARSHADAIAMLRTRDAKTVPTGHAEVGDPKVVFMFPGGGAQYARMGAELYERDDVYRDAIDACLDIITPALGRDLRELMFCAPDEAKVATRTLERPSLTLPSLFATSYALAKLFESWGVTPTALVGHSMGEYVAACLAGVFSLEDGLRLVMLRGRLFEKVQAGGMLSVSLPEAEVKKIMPAGLSIAAVNAPELCVASGPVAAIDALEKLLAEREIECTRIRIDVAAHSSMLDPILEEFRALCRSIPFQPPTIPIVSNLTGRWLSPAEATDPEYWVKHLRGTVRFADCIETVLTGGDRALLEVGPGRTLSSLARAQRTPVKAAFNSVRHPQEEASDLAYALTALGRLWVAGVDVDWTALYAGQLRNRVELPSYPFESQSFWIEPGQLLAHAGTRALSKRADIADWFYDLSWMQRPLLVRGTPATRFCVFSDGSSFSEKLIESLGEREVVVVTQGNSVAQISPKHWQVDPESSNQFVDLVQALQEQGQLPQHVVYLWSASRPLQGFSARRSLAQIEKNLGESFFAPVYLARALGGLAEPVQLTYVTAGLAQTGDEPTLPHRATILGPLHVTPREFAQLRTRCIDLPLALGTRTRRLAEQLADELLGDCEDRLVALRGSERWVQTIAPLKLPEAPSEQPWLRAGGVYLITGGLGGIGLEVATHMARSKRIKLALLARAGLPPEQEWDAILARPDAKGRGAARIRKVRELRALGAEVLILAGDVVDHESMKRVIARVHEELGPLSGVVHAAGVLDDEPMQTKTAPGMRRVLAPKVHGTLTLDALIHEPLDFFLVFSSVASFLGLPGQVDYTAANAFLDAFAHERSRRAPGRSLVINWNAWRDVGMAAQSYSQMPSPSASCTHPALDGYSEESGAGRVFSTDFSLERHWMLGEHRIKGSYALLPGTAYVELARAAFSVGRGDGPVEITDLTFASPFQVAPGETRRLNIHLTPAGDAYEVAMRSGGDPRSAPHVVGDVRAYNGPPPKRIDLAAIASRCTLREELPKDRFLDQDFVAFGPRWANMERIRYGKMEALIELSLDERFADDLAYYRLHPAVMDMATGGAQPLIPNVDLKNDFYVPLSYGRVRFLSPMPRQVFSHVRCLDDTGDGFAYFDVTLCGADGVPFAEVSRFTMKRLGARSAMTAAPVARSNEPPRNEAMETLLREAIGPAEGIDAFARIMAQSHVVQAVASSVDVQLWDTQLTAQSALAAGDGEGGAPAGFARPNLASDYEAPETKTEQALVEVWAELVGIRQVGVRDDFFELGGNSLVAVRLFAAIKKQFKVSLPLSTLFEAPTIRQLAQLLEARLAPQPETPKEGGLAAVPAAARGYSSLVAMQPSGTRPPFFCAAGMGGNPLNLAALALLVGLDQPFYGLQPQGLDGQSTPHSSVPEMAAYYLDLIRQKQPRGPYYLGGYSGGGITAFEMARQLEAAGEEVGALVFLDSFAPIMPERSATDRARVHLERLREQGPLYVTRTLGSRVRSEIDSVKRVVRRPLSKLFPYRFRLETVADMWLESAAAYQPGTYQGSAMLFRAAVASALTSGTAKVIDELHGWGPFVLGGVEVSVCPGDHNTICEQPNVRVLARRLRAYLDRRMVHKAQLQAAE